MDLIQDERQSILELMDKLMDKVDTCVVISDTENIEKFKELLDSDRLGRVKFIEPPNLFNNQNVDKNKVFLIPIKNKPEK